MFESKDWLYAVMFWVVFFVGVKLAVDVGIKRPMEMKMKQFFEVPAATQ